MSLGSNDNKVYGAPDFERYYSGQMTAQERHALEKAALDDPFLADALEGYQATRTPAADAAWLRAQLQAKTERAKVVPLTPKKTYPFLRIAALILLLLGAGWGVYRLADSKRDTLALELRNERTTTTTQAPAPAATPDTALKEADTAPSASTNEVAATPVPKAAGQAPTAFAHRKGERPSVKTEAAPPAETGEPPVASVAVSEAPKPMALRDAETKAAAPVEKRADVTANALQGRVAGIAVQQGTREHLFQGRVVDQKNNAVPNATVSLRNSRKGVVTDEEGRFSLNASDTALKATVAAIGFEPQTITLNNAQEETSIVLKENTSALNEVVVVGYGKKHYRKPSGKPEPVEGWEAFQNYIKQNRKPSKELSTEDLAGSVVLSFDVNKNGDPVRIKIDSSLSPRHDEEAIRLLREGPKWKKGKGNRGRVTIPFL